MAKPLIFVVDDDPEVLRAVERDLRRKYASDYKVVRSDSGNEAVKALEQYKVRGDVVALFVSDQRMPEMDGVEFISQAMRLYPDAKKVLLTAYADTSAAIKAINSARIDYYLMKPWDPPEERLYPILDDLLDDWLSGYRPPFEGVRVIGNQWSPKSHAIKDFLARNQVPYQWLDVERTPEASELLTFIRKGDESATIPLVVFSDGAFLSEPSQQQIAEKIGLRTRADKPFYDVAIVGGGPAGLAAAVYGASEGLSTVMIEREAPGGQAGTSSRIENYLGFPSGLTGAELARRAVAQAQRFGVELLSQEVTSVRIDGNYRILTLADGSEISCHALIVATGVSYRKLDVPGVEQLTGAGVYYGAAQTEAMSCKDDDVYIIGGANSAGQAAMYFSRYARRVVMLVRSDSLSKSMSQYLIDQIGDTPNIEVRVCTEVTEAHGDNNLTAITIRDSAQGITETVPATGLFIFIGAMPRTDWLGDVVERDAQGFIYSGTDILRDGRRPKTWNVQRDPFLLETSVPGIFVAGDVRKSSVKRVASAVGEGSIAIQFVHQYLATL
jgi:thioredoxin reductase (NADPH)